MEEDDRTETIVEANWSDLWKRLERTGEPPELNSTLEALTTVGLVAVSEAGQGEANRKYDLHPGVTEAGQVLAGKAFQAAVDTELAAFWVAGFQQGRKEETRGGGGLVVLAGRRAVPYLLRHEHWETVSRLLEQTLIRDSSPATATAVLPWLRRIAEATQGTEQELRYAGLLTRALALAERVAEAEVQFREIIDQAEARGAFRVASAAAGELINLLRNTGHTQAALAVVERMKDLTRRARLGPCSQLRDEVLRLQLLNRLGRHEEVLAAVEALRTQLKSLPETGGKNDPVPPWHVREILLDTGCFAALTLERWEGALALSAKIVESQQDRRAPALGLARTRFNDYGPLLRLGRHEEVRRLLEDCRTIFEAEGDVRMLGAVFGALADLEDKLNHQEQALAFAAAALRYSYRSPNPKDCAVIHFNLANYLMRSGGPPEAVLAQQLAAGVIDFQTGSGYLASTLQALANDLARLAPDPPLPASFDELCERVEAVEGVRFQELFERLPRRAVTGDEALAEVIRLARELSKPGDRK